MRIFPLVIGVIGGGATIAYANAYAVGGDRTAGIVFGAFIIVVGLALALLLKKGA